jgi:hypothetical protein
MTVQDVRTGADASADAGSADVAAPLVASVYANYPCRSTSGGAKIVPDAVVDLGKPGPIVLFWQCSAFTDTPNRGMKAVPLVNELVDTSLETAVFVSATSTHVPLLRRRAPNDTMPEGQSMFGIVTSGGVHTDPNDIVNMAALNVSDMSARPKVKLSAVGLAASSGLYTEQTFVADGHPMLVSVAATASSKQAGRHIGAQLLIDNNPDANFQVFANVTGQHMSLVGGDRVRSLPQGRHTLRLLPHANTTIDTNDLWSLSVIEFPAPATVAELFANAFCKEQSGGGVIASAPYTSKGGTQMICLWVSAYARQAQQTMSATVQVDGNPVGSLQIFPAIAGSHMLLCGGDIVPGSIPAGQHTIEVVAGGNTVTDANDRVSLTVFEVLR